MSDLTWRLIDEKYDVALVACSAKKLEPEGQLPARRLYQGHAFKMALKIAEKVARRTLILSAEYGAVSPDRPLFWYDKRLPTDKTELDGWAARCADEVNLYLERDRVRHTPRVLILAPAAYATVRLFQPWLAECPLRGLGIGQQLGWLKRELGRVQ